MQGPLPTHAPTRFALYCGLIATVLLLGVLVPVWRAVGLYCFDHYDLGIYSQAIASISWHNLNPFLTGRQIRIFNDHFDPAVFFAVPLAALVPPWTAGLLVEAAAVLGALVPLVWLQRHGVLTRRAVLLVALVVLFSPGTISALRFPIHPTTWAIFPITLLVAALLLRRPRVALLALVLLFACREEFPFAGLMLAVGLWLQGERRFALQVLTLSAAWLLFVFGVRPLVWGRTEPYALSLLRGDTHWLSYFVTRLTVHGMWSRIGSLLVPVLPAAVWAVHKRLRPDWAVAAMLLPMLGIRFLGMAWRHHYGAPVAAMLAALLATMLVRRELPRWLLPVTVVLLLTTNSANLRFALKMWGAPINTPPRDCPADPGRLATIGRDVTFLRDHPNGPALVEGNLFTQLVQRPHLYVLGGLTPPPIAHYAYVLVEKPRLGDPYPLSRQRVAQLISTWRPQSSQILEDDGHVFFARGAFEPDR